MFGIDPLQTIRAFKGVPIYYKNRKLLKRQEKHGGKKFPFATPYPCLSDRFESADSLSCLHALEHFGLGRYGDPVNYNGYLLGLDNLYLILKKGGKFYFSVPIGPQRIEFDAHRVFSISYLLELFDNKYHIDHFSYVDDKGNLHENELITDKSKNDNFNCNYGCGIFEMTKL